MRRITVILAFILIACSARSQSDNWEPVGPHLFELPFQIYSLTNIGDSMMVALGDFIYVQDSNNLANGVAVYKNGQWSGWSLLGVNYHPLSKGCYAPSGVVSFNGEIVFSSTDYVQDTIGIDPPWGPFYQIRAWDGQDFDTLGCSNSSLTRLKVLDGELYAHGWFSRIGGIDARGLAKWTGEKWISLDNPFAYDSPTIADIYIYDNKLWVGGNFDNPDDQPYSEIAYLDLTDSTWNNLNGGIKQDVYSGVGSFMEYQGELYVGGSFRYDYGNAGHHIMKWNGSGFDDVGGGVFGQNYAYNNWAQVKHLEVFEGDLWVGGDFDWAGGIFHPSIATWNGTEWCTMGDSIMPFVSDIEIFQGELYALTNAAVKNSEIKILKWIGGNYRDTCGTWPLSVPEPSTSEVSLFPNPVSDILNVSGIKARSSFMLLDVRGRVVRTGSINPGEGIDMHGLEPGVYLLRLTKGQQEPMTYKVIKS